MIADSVSPLGVRLTSVELQFPRFVLPQILMHRQWSRSCESLRARPTKSKLKEVEESPVVPVFAKNRKGMVAGDPMTKAGQKIASGLWREAATMAVRRATAMAELGVAKQWANRLLEPFAYQKVLVTATDFGNFFRLRCADDAQPEVQEVACKLREAVAASVPTVAGYGEWHRPYLSEFDHVPAGTPEAVAGAFNRVSAARCARVSYCTHDGKRDVDADLTLARTLLDSAHSNPFEHQATPAPDNRRYANLKGWVSYRYQLEQQGVLPDPEGGECGD